LIYKKLASTASSSLKELRLRPVELELSEYNNEDFAPIDRQPEWIRQVIDKDEINKEFMETRKRKK
jgi:hypothetical protein